VEFEMAPRRPGDPAVLVASAKKAREVLGWEPQARPRRDRAHDPELDAESSERLSRRRERDGRRKLAVIGEVVGHFEIQSELGRGGMARVFKAWDRVLNRHVAIKVLNATPGEGPFAPGDSDYARILHEARAGLATRPSQHRAGAPGVHGGAAGVSRDAAGGRPEPAPAPARGAARLDEGRRIAVAIAAGCRRPTGTASSIATSNRKISS
jgi:hypothetical protein